MPSFRDKPEVRGVLYGAILFVLAVAVAMLGPSLLQFALQTDSSVQETGWIMGVRSFAYLAGGFVAPVYDKLPGHVVLGVSAILGGAITALFPYCKSLIALGAVAVGQGVVLCQLDVGANILLLFLGMPAMKQNMFLQGLHFAFALGATISPLMLQVSASAAGASSAAAPIKPATGNEEVVYVPGAYNGAYLFAAGLCIAVGVVTLLLPSPRRRGKELDGEAAAAGGDVNNGIGKLEDVDLNSASNNNINSSSSSSNAVNVSDQVAILPAKQQQDDSSSSSEGVAVQKSNDVVDAKTAALAAEIAAEPLATENQLRKSSWIVVAEVAAILGFYVGAEAGYGFLLTGISVIGWGLTEAQGQSLTAGYWGAITAGRLAAVPLSRVMKAERMLAIDIIGSIASLVLLVFLQGSLAGIWFATLSYGVFMASTYPSAIALLDSYVTVEGKMGTAIVLGGASGEWLIPFLIASSLGGAQSEGGALEIAPEDATKAKTVFLALNLLSCVGTLVAFWLLMRHGPRLKLRKERFLKERKQQTQQPATAAGGFASLHSSGGSALNAGGFGAAASWEHYDGSKHHYGYDGAGAMVLRTAPAPLADDPSASVASGSRSQGDPLPLARTHLHNSNGRFSNDSSGDVHEWAGGGLSNSNASFPELSPSSQLPSRLEGQSAQFFSAPQQPRPHPHLAHGNAGFVSSGGEYHHPTAQAQAHSGDDEWR